MVTLSTASSAESDLQKSKTTFDSSDQECPSEPSCSQLYARVLSGSVGSLVTALAVTPLEVAKVRQQTNTSSHIPSNVSPCPRGCGTFVFHNGLSECLLPKSAVPYFDELGNIVNTKACRVSSASNLGTFALVRRIFLNEGLSGIYAGLAPTLVMSVPNTVLYFTAYDEIVSRLKASTDSAWWAPMVGGVSARLLATFSTAPLELVRTRQAAVLGSIPSKNNKNTRRPGLWAELRTIVQTDGVLSLYKGLTPTLWRDVPFSAVYWMCLEQMRTYWKEQATGEPSLLQQTGQAFANGAISGMIAAACTTPFDVAKTLQQAGLQQTATAQSSICSHRGAVAYQPAIVVHRRGMLDIMRQILETQGVSGLWRGNQTRMIKVAPACAIMISCYEMGKRILA